MLEDLGLRGLECGAGFKAELVGLVGADASVGIERFGLSSAPAEGEHELAGEAFADGICRDELEQLTDEGGVLAGREVGFDAGFQCGEALLFQALDLGLGERLEG